MIETTYLNEFATKINTDVTKVLINDIIEITDFALKNVTGSVFQLKFNVLKSQTELITNIKLKKTNDDVVSNNDVSILVPFDEIIIRHTITISEVIE